MADNRPHPTLLGGAVVPPQRAAAHVVGKTGAEIQAVRDQIEAMLTEEGPPPGGDWAALSALAPAKDAKPRHGAILLPFDAVLKGLEES